MRLLGVAMVLPMHPYISKCVYLPAIIGIIAFIQGCGFRADSLQSLRQATTVVCQPNTAPADGTTAITVHIQVGDSLLTDNQDIEVGLEVSPNLVVIAQPGSPNKNGETSGLITSTTPGSYSVRAYLQLRSVRYYLDEPLIVTFTKLPQVLELSAVPPSISVDTQQTVTVYAALRDSSQKAITNTPIIFRSNFSEDMVAPSTVSTNEQGEATATFSSTRSGTHVITATTLETSSTVAVDIIAGACDSTYSKISVNPNTIFFGANQNQTDITVQAYDRYQNPVQNVEVTLSSSEISDTLSENVQTTDATGAAIFRLSADTAGNSNLHMLQATMQNVTLNANVWVLPGADPAYSTFEVNPSTQIADNANVITATVTVRDNQNHPISNMPVSFSASGITTQLSNASATSDNNGKAVCMYYSSVAQNENIVAQVQDITYTSSISFTHGPENADLSYLALTPASQPANGTDALHISAHLKDRFGNAVGNKAVDFTLYGTAGPFSPNSSMTSGLGIAQTDLVSSVAGSSQIYASTPVVTLEIKANFTSNAGYCNSEPNYTVNSVTTASAPQNIIASDLNQDGCLDLVVTENGYNTVGIFTGDCHGNFTNTYRAGVGSHPWGVVAVDLNLDGHTDLAVATAGDGNVSVLLGVGDGTFQTAITYSAIYPLASRAYDPYTNIPFEISTADFNEDGYPDLAVASGLDNQLVVFLGTGLGTLNPGKSYATGVKPWGLAVADFNKDGHADIALPINNQGTYQNYVSLWAGIGDGNFKSKATYASQNCVQGIGIGDFNGDSYPDLAVPNECESALSIFWGGDSNTNLGRGPLASAPSYLLEGTVTTSLYNNLSAFGGLKLYDFDQDGALDVVVTDTRPSTSHTALFLGSPNGTLTFANEAGTSNYGLAMDVGDINEDGIKDVIVSTSDQNSNNATLDILSFNAGTKQLDFVKSIALPSFAYGVVAQDINGDGHVDIAFASNQNYGSVGVFLGQGNGNFNDATYFNTNAQPSLLVLGDWDQDGNQDIALTTATGIDLMYGHGDGSFTYTTTLSPDLSVGSIASADLNGDGILDLAVSVDSQAQLAVFSGKGGGEFENPRFYNVDYPLSTGIVAGDLNGDGYPDIIATHAATTYLSSDQQFSISVFFGTNSGIFQDAVYYQAGRGNPSVQVGDLNQDGHLDVVTGSVDNMLVTLFNKGDGALQSNTSYLANSAAWSIHVNDFNGDAIQDLVIPNGLKSNVTNLFIGKGDGTFKQPYNLAFGTSAISAVSGYFNNDSYMDFAVTDIKKNRIYVYLYSSCSN